MAAHARARQQPCTHALTHLALLLAAVRQMAEVTARGALLPDDMVLALLRGRLARGAAAGERGVLLDGFPRTRAQAVRQRARGAHVPRRNAAPRRLRAFACVPRVSLTPLRARCRAARRCWTRRCTWTWR